MTTRRGLAYRFGLALLMIAASYAFFSWRNTTRINAAFTTAERRILEHGDQYILYSLHPSPMELSDDDQKKEKFHGFMIIGQTELKDSHLRSSIIGSIYRAIGKSVGAACFNPRHGLRVVHGTESVDLVICLQCGNVDIYDGAGDKREVQISASPRAVLHGALSDAGVPLAPQ